MTDVPEEKKDMDTRLPSVRGKRFYQPWALLLYSVLANFPIAIFLYGINVHRRGNIIGGHIIKGMAIVMMAAITIIAIIGTDIRAFHWILIGIAIGIGLMQAEKLHYERCIAHGASAARWWPPLLFLLAQSFAVIVMADHYGR